MAAQTGLLDLDGNPKDQFPLVACPVDCCCDTNLSCELSLDISGVEVGDCWTTGFWRSSDARRRVLATVDFTAVDATAAWNRDLASCWNIEKSRNEFRTGI